VIFSEKSLVFAFLLSKDWKSPGAAGTELLDFPLIVENVTTPETPSAETLF
jgi:hypothetical protein